VRVPVRNRIGEENGGWYVAAATLDFERSNVALAITARRGARRLADYIRDRSRGDSPVHRAARLALVDRFVEIEVAELLSFLVVSVQAAGGVPNKEASTCKMYGTEVWQRL